MRTIILLIILLILPSICSAQKQTSKNLATQGSVVQILTQMSWDEANAFKNYDTAALDRILADDWVLVAVDGQRHTKADLLGELKAHKGALTSVTLDSIVVRVFGDTAVVTGNDEEKHISFDGKDVSGRYAWTDVYVKQKDGRWRIVASHASKITTSP